MIAELPFFLSNKEWYYYDKENFRYKLTPNATPEAIKSYEEFYKAYEEKNGKICK